MNSEDDIPIFTRNKCDLSVGCSELSEIDVVRPKQMPSYLKESADVSSQAVVDLTDTDSGSISISLPAAVTVMLRELEKPFEEFNSLADLFANLRHFSDDFLSNNNCSLDCDIFEDNADAAKTRLSGQKQKAGSDRCCGLRPRIAKLEENSREIVSKFIPPDAPTLAFSDDSIGMP